MIDDQTGREQGVGAMFRPRTPGNRVFAGVTALAFGLLLWTKLILVTNHPKTAIAAPPVPDAGAALSDERDLPLDPGQSSEMSARSTGSGPVGDPAGR